MGEAWMEEFDLEECWRHLRGESVGRVGCVTNELITVLPVNYRVVDKAGQSSGRWLALRTRPGNVIDRAAPTVAFEIDGVLPNREGWSVLVRGTLHHVDPDAAAFREQFDSDPWLAEERDAWLIVEPFQVTGRRLHHGDVDWAFDPVAYL